MKSYNHTTLISPRREGVAMATKHFLKHGNGVHYCSVSLAVAKKVSVAVLFHMNFGPRAKPKVEDGKCGRPASQSYLLECFNN